MYGTIICVACISWLPALLASLVRWSIRIIWEMRYSPLSFRTLFHPDLNTSIPQSLLRLALYLIQVILSRGRKLRPVLPLQRIESVCACANEHCASFKGSPRFFLTSQIVDEARHIVLPPQYQNGLRLPSAPTIKARPPIMPAVYDQTRQPALYASTGVLLCIATTAVFLRLLARRKSEARFWWE